MLFRTLITVLLAGAAPLMAQRELNTPNGSLDVNGWSDVVRYTFQ